jgi:hypothetical protein
MGNFNKPATTTLPSKPTLPCVRCLRDAGKQGRSGLFYIGGVDVVEEGKQ